MMTLQLSFLVKQSGGIWDRVIGPKGSRITVDQIVVS